MKIVINKCFGGFELSMKGKKRLGELQGKDIYFYKQIRYNFEEGIDEYQKVADLDKESLSTHVVTKDFGEFASDVEINEFYYNDYGLERNDENLIQVVEELGKEANGQCSNLKIIEIPDGIEYEISDYDGVESIEELHRSWE